MVSDSDPRTGGAPGGPALVTGGAGFIGSALVRRLVAHGVEVTVWHRPDADLSRLESVRDRVRCVPVDLLSADDWRPALRSLEPAAVYHLAWCATPGRYLTDPDNLSHLRAGIELVQELTDQGRARLCFAGTCYEYDTNAGLLREDETPEAPRYLYSAAKLALKNAALQAVADAGMTMAWSRIFWLHGPMEHPARLVPMIVRELSAGRPLQLRSHGQQVRDFLHVDDVAAGLHAAIGVDRPQVVNIGSGRPVSVRDLAIQIADRLGCRELLSFAPPDTPLQEPPFVCADNTRLRSLGWREQRAGDLVADPSSQAVTG